MNEESIQSLEAFLSSFIPHTAALILHPFRPSLTVKVAVKAFTIARARS
jgi:hypothetical protein